MGNERMGLLEESIATLRELADCFASDLTGSLEPSSNVVGRTSKELLLSITVLLPKLEAARAIFQPPRFPPVRCEQCDGL